MSNSNAADPNSDRTPNRVQTPSNEKYITIGQMNLINDFRTLWRDMVIWLRSYMVSTTTGFSNLPAIINRLYRIPRTFYDKFAPYFGEVKSEELAHLILMYIVNIQTLVNAEISNDQTAADFAVRNLHRYTEEMAGCLEGFNPYWSKDQWVNLLGNLTSMIIQEIIALLEEEYELELDIRERMLSHALVLGDYMAGGVMNYLVP